MERDDDEFPRRRAISDEKRKNPPPPRLFPRPPKKRDFNTTVYTRASDSRGTGEDGERNRRKRILFNIRTRNGGPRLSGVESPLFEGFMPGLARGEFV